MPALILFVALNFEPAADLIRRTPDFKLPWI